MGLVDISQPEEPTDGCQTPKATEGLNINITLVMGAVPPPAGCGMGHPHHGAGGPELGSGHPDKLDAGCCKDTGNDHDLMKQLVEAISLIDTATDGVESGTQKPEGALAAIDDMTSRVLWGKQEDDNPMSSYQNANYGATTSNGMVMQNPAVTFNKDAYGTQLDPDQDGDVDFHNPGATDKIDQAQGFRKAADNVIQKSREQRDGKAGPQQRGSVKGNSFGSEKRQPEGEDDEPESTKG